MKLTSNSISAIIALTAVVASAAVAFGQAAAPAAPAANAAAGARAGGGGGGGGGRGAGGGVGTAGLAAPMPEGGLVTTAIKPNELNDIETTQITAWELTIQKQIAAQRDARTALNDAAWKSPANPSDIQTKVNALAAADLALATARADGLAKLKTQFPAQKMPQVIRMLSGTGGGRGGG